MKNSIAQQISPCPYQFIITVQPFVMSQTMFKCSSQVLDMISVQGKSNALTWKEKDSRAFFRGRDSRQERLDLVELVTILLNFFNFFFTCKPPTHHNGF